MRKPCPTRTRGDGLRGTGDPVSPARAGMDPSSGSVCTRSRSSFPRTRGDGPSAPTAPSPPSGFPPHARGWTRRGLGCAVLWVSPARAGMDPPMKDGGDGPHRKQRAEGISKVSPARAGMDPVNRDLEFPPHAGMAGSCCGMDPEPRARWRRFPRTRGDGPEARFAGMASSSTGFPPHARGWTVYVATRQGGDNLQFPPHARGWTLG